MTSTYALPDARGWVELSGGGKADLRLELEMRSDTFTPAWTDKTWKHVQLKPGTLIRVKLEDHDPLNKLNPDDPIGMADITSAELQSAVNQGIVILDRHEVTQNQLLYVKVSVQAE